MQDVYQNEYLNKQIIMWWHKAFLEEHESTEKLNSSGWSFTSIIEENVNTLATIIWEDWHLSIWDLTASIKSMNKRLYASQNTDAIILPAICCAFGYFGQDLPLLFT